MVSSLGIGSGLDLQSLVNQLVAAERQPALTRLTIKEAGFQSQLSAFGSLKSTASSLDDALESLQGVALKKLAKVVNGEGILTASADETAVSGSYTIRSEQLASSQGFATTALATEESVVGEGTLIIQRGQTGYNPDTDTFLSFVSSGDPAIEIDFTDPNTTLADVRDAINASEAGISAAIVNDDSGARLALSSTETGEENTFRIEVEEPGGIPANNIDTVGLSMFAFNESATNLQQTVAARDAIASVNGLQITSSTNSFDNSIQGLSFELLSASEDDVTVTVGNDTGSVATQLRGYIDAYNEFVDFTKSVANYNPETQEAGILFGDATLRSLGTLLRRGISTGLGDGGSPLQSLLDVGLDFDGEGKLELDQEELDAAIESDFDAVIELVQKAGENLQTSVSSFVDSEGLIDARTEGLQARIQDIGDQRVALDRRTEVLERRFTNQFAALDTLLAGLENTSSFLSQQLSNLNVNSGNNR